MFPAPALPRITENEPLSCDPPQNATAGLALAVDAATAAPNTSRVSRRDISFTNLVEVGLPSAADDSTVRTLSSLALHPE